MGGVTSPNPSAPHVERTITGQETAPSKTKPPRATGGRLPKQQDLIRAVELLHASVDSNDGEAIVWDRQPSADEYFALSDEYSLQSLDLFTDTSLPSSSPSSLSAEFSTCSDLPAPLDSPLFDVPANLLSDHQWTLLCGDLPSVKLGGRLQDFADVYEAAGAWAFIPEWLRKGVPLPFFNAKIPPSRRQKNHSSAFDHADFVSSEIQKLLRQGAIMEFDSPYCVSPLGVAVREKDNKRRVVVDLRYLNTFIMVPTFRMELLYIVPDIVQAMEYMFSADLRGGYHHVAIHPDFWTFLGFEWLGKTYVFKVLPFGLNLSPFVFSKITRWVMKHFRTQDQKGMVYIDDFLFGMGFGFDSACVKVTGIVRCLRQFGWILAADKSVRVPNARVQHLGMIIDSRQAIFEAPEWRLASTERKLRSLLESSESSPPSYRMVASALGSLVSLSPAIGPVGIYSVELMAIFRGAKLAKRSSWNASVSISPAARNDILFWLHNLRRRNGQSAWLPSSAVQLLSDAGETGFGATLYVASKSLDFKGVWDANEASQSSTWREMMAVLLSLRHFQSYLAGQLVIVTTDNQANASCLSKLGSKSVHLAPVLREIWSLSLSARFWLKAHWLPRVFLSYQDQLGRISHTKEDWQINPSIFSMLDRRWGPHSIDRFATPHNRVLLRFNCPFFSSGSSGVNAFDQHWGQDNNWLNPGFNLVLPAFRHLQFCKAAGTLIAPHWESQHWWSLLSSHATETVFLPSLDKCILNYGNQCSNTPRVMGPPIPKWSLVAFRFDFSL